MKSFKFSQLIENEADNDDTNTKRDSKTRRHEANHSFREKKSFVDAEELAISLRRGKPGPKGPKQGPNNGKHTNCTPTEYEYLQERCGSLGYPNSPVYADKLMSTAFSPYFMRKREELKSKMDKNPRAYVGAPAPRKANVFYLRPDLIELFFRQITIDNTKYIEGDRFTLITKDDVTYLRSIAFDIVESNYPGYSVLFGKTLTTAGVRTTTLQHTSSTKLTVYIPTKVDSGLEEKYENFGSFKMKVVVGKKAIKNLPLTKNKRAKDAHAKSVNRKWKRLGYEYGGKECYECDTTITVTEPCCTHGFHKHVNLAAQRHYKLMHEIVARHNIWVERNTTLTSSSTFQLIDDNSFSPLVSVVRNDADMQHESVVPLSFKRSNILKVSKSVVHKQLYLKGVDSGFCPDYNVHGFFDAEPQVVNPVGGGHIDWTRATPQQIAQMRGNYDSNLLQMQNAYASPNPLDPRIQKHRNSPISNYITNDQKKITGGVANPTTKMKKEDMLKKYGGDVGVSRNSVLPAPVQKLEVKPDKITLGKRAKREPGNVVDAPIADNKVVPPPPPEPAPPNIQPFVLNAVAANEPEFVMKRIYSISYIDLVVNMIGFLKVFTMVLFGFTEDYESVYDFILESVIPFGETHTWNLIFCGYVTWNEIAVDANEIQIVYETLRARQIDTPKVYENIVHFCSSLRPPIKDRFAMLYAAQRVMSERIDANRYGITTEGVPLQSLNLVVPGWCRLVSIVLHMCLTMVLTSTVLIIAFIAIISVFINSWKLVLISLASLKTLVSLLVPGISLFLALVYNTMGWSIATLQATSSVLHTAISVTSVPAVMGYGSILHNKAVTSHALLYNSGKHIINEFSNWDSPWMHLTPLYEPEPMNHILKGSCESTLTPLSSVLADYTRTAMDGYLHLSNLTLNKMSLPRMENSLAPLSILNHRVQSLAQSSWSRLNSSLNNIHLPATMELLNLSNLHLSNIWLEHFGEQSTNAPSNIRITPYVTETTLPYVYGTSAKDDLCLLKPISVPAMPLVASTLLPKLKTYYQAGIKNLARHYSNSVKRISKLDIHPALPFHQIPTLSTLGMEPPHTLTLYLPSPPSLESLSAMTPHKLLTHVTNKLKLALDSPDGLLQLNLLSMLSSSHFSSVSQQSLKDMKELCYQHWDQGYAHLGDVLVTCQGAAASLHAHISSIQELFHPLNIMETQLYIKRYVSVITDQLNSLGSTSGGYTIVMRTEFMEYANQAMHDVMALQRTISSNLPMCIALLQITQKYVHLQLVQFYHTTTNSLVHVADNVYQVMKIPFIYSYNMGVNYYEGVIHETHRQAPTKVELPLVNLDDYL